MNAQDPIARAKALCAQHLAECCRDILEWDRTAVLPEGRVREAAALLEDENTDTGDALRIVEGFITRAAMTRILNTAGDEWPSIDTAPREIVSRDGIHGYGRYILAWPARGGEVSRVRWWQAGDNSNFIDDGNCAVFPRVWTEMPMPAMEGENP